MPYNIEIVALGDDLYARLADTIRWLSSLQREFQFHFPPPRLLRHLVGTAATSPAPFATGTHFTTAEAWTALRSYRSIAKGDRRYLIAFTSSSLSSTKYQNLFASAEAGEGLAVVTIADQERFTASFDAYVAYYLTRYSLGFVVPDLRNHDDTRSCLFDRKIYKPDLRLSLRSGRLCDACLPVVKQAFNEEIERAIDLMTRAIRDAELAAELGEPSPIRPTTELPVSAPESRPDQSRHADQMIHTPSSGAAEPVSGTHTESRPARQPGRTSGHDHVDLLIVTALTEEAQVVAATLLLAATHVCADGALTFYEYALADGRSARLATASAHSLGAVSMSVFTSPLLREVRPRSATLVGIAAAIDTDVVQVGDVPFSSHVLSYDDIAVDGGRLTFRTEGYPVDPSMRRAAGALRTTRRTYEPWQDDCLRLLDPVIAELNRLRRQSVRPPEVRERPHLVVEVTAGGPFLLRDRGFREDLRKPHKEPGPVPRVQLEAPVHPKLVSAEMESHGFMRAAHEQGIPATVIKGISDNGDSEKAQQEKESGGYYRAFACCNAVLAALHILRHIDRPPP